MEAVRTTLNRHRSQGLCSANISDHEHLMRQAAKMNALAGDLNDGVSCATCSNKGIEFMAENGRIISRECACMTQRRNMRRLRQSGLMSVVERCTFDTYETPEAWQKRLKRGVMDFAKSVESLQNKWLFIGGGVGSGKTHLCTAASVELMKKYDMYYMKWVDEAQEIKSCVNDSEKYTRIMQELKTVKVLYIDDLFKAAPSGPDIRLAYEIINSRYQDDRLITIISSEKHVAEIEGIDSAVGSRIYEKARGHTFNLKKDKNRNYRIRDMSVF